MAVAAEVAAVPMPTCTGSRSLWRWSVGAVLASVPIVAIYVFFLDYYVSGLTAGAVKG